MFINDEGKSGGEVRGAANAYTVSGWQKMIAKKPDLDQRKDSKGGAATTSGSEATPAASVKSW